FAGNTTVGYLWIHDFYWFQFENSSLRPPEASVALGGGMGNATCCRPSGRVALNGRAMKVRQSMTLDLEGKSFFMTRNKDTNYKVFTVMPPNLS
ncbi:MAG: hypothetical protein QM692_22890, partial [Thermomicrobiales bacterium]